MNNRKATMKRRSAIIRELSDLSRDSWSRARPEDYWPLEDELRRMAEAEAEAELWASHRAAAKKGGKYI